MKIISIFTAIPTIWGNIRVSYSKNADGSAEVLEENNFYPFGFKHEGYNAQLGNPAYNYEYNGKELQKETGWSDYGARMYMSDIGRWGVIDPLAEMMRRYSPYNYAYNNPISFTDPDGRKPLSWEDEQRNIVTKVAPEGSLWWVYASGGHVGAGMQGGGDGIGDFFAQMRRRGGGGGGSATSGSSAASSGTSSTSSPNAPRETVDVEIEEVVITGKKGKSSYNMMLLHLALINAIEKQLVKLESSQTSLYTPLSQWNTLLSFNGVSMSALSDRRYIGTARTNSPFSYRGVKYYGNGRTFLKSESLINTKGSIKIGKGLGFATVGVTAVLDYKAYKNGEIRGDKFAANSIMGAYGLTGAGTLPVIVYFGFDNFYPGGLSGYTTDLGEVQAELDNGFNQAGPYRINLTGAHEPK